MPPLNYMYDVKCPQCGDNTLIKIKDIKDPDSKKAVGVFVCRICGNEICVEYDERKSD